jgi:hypothetical protein
VRLSVLLAALVACAAAPCFAQARPALATAAPSPNLNGHDALVVDPDVMLAISGGRWASGAQRGSIRLLLLRANWDHVVPSRLVVQWLEQQPGAKRVVVHASRDADAIPAGGWALGVPRLEQRNGVWHAVVTGAADAGRIRRTWRFALDIPGKLREVPLR